MTSINYFTYFSPQKVSFIKVSYHCKEQRVPCALIQEHIKLQVKPELVEVSEERDSRVPEVDDGNETVRSHADATRSVQFSRSRPVGPKLLEKDAG